MAHLNGSAPFVVLAGVCLSLGFCRSAVAGQFSLTAVSGDVLATKTEDFQENLSTLSDEALAARIKYLEGALSRSTYRLYGGAEDHVRAWLDFYLDSLTPAAPITVGSLQIIKALSEVDRAFQHAKPINESIDLLLKVTRENLPQELAAMKDWAATLVTAYDAYTHGDYETALRAPTDQAVKDGIQVAARMAFKKAIIDQAKNILGATYAAILDAEVVMRRHRSFRHEQERHYGFLKQLGEANREHARRDSEATSEFDRQYCQADVENARRLQESIASGEAYIATLRGYGNFEGAANWANAVASDRRLLAQVLAKIRRCGAGSLNRQRP